jgi:hypothetical protein
VALFVEIPLPVSPPLVFHRRDRFEEFFGGKSDAKVLTH